MTDLRGAHAIVTGASRGLGVPIAEALVAGGSKVTLAARSQPELEATAERLRARGATVAVVPVDVTDAGQREELLRAARAELGPVDILVNNAGIEITSSLVDLEAAEVEQVIAVNLTAPLLLTRMVLPEMIERRRGHVLNMASTAGKSGPPFESVYAATKAGLVRVSEALRAELAGTGVSVSAVCPGFVSGDGMYARTQRETGVRASRLLGTTTPEKVARAVVKALERDSPELIVTPGPFRLLLAAAELVPVLRRPITNRFVFDQLQRVAQHRQAHAADQTSPAPDA